MTGRKATYRPGTSSIWKWIGTPPGHEEKASPKALADREKRQAMADTRSVTGRLLGDPPPGRSALDQRLEDERRRAGVIEALKRIPEDEGTNDE
jgi:hypothetical protein